MANQELPVAAFNLWLGQKLALQSLTASTESSATTTVANAIDGQAATSFVSKSGETDA